MMLGPFSRGDEQRAPSGRTDVHSFARPDQIRVTHVDLVLVVEFERKVLGGSAILSVERASQYGTLITRIRRARPIPANS